MKKALFAIIIVTTDINITSNNEDDNENNTSDNNDNDKDITICNNNDDDVDINITRNNDDDDNNNTSNNIFIARITSIQRIMTMAWRQLRHYHRL